MMIAGATVVASAERLHAATEFPAGLVYTEKAPQRWAGKEGAHVPDTGKEAG